MFYTLVSNEHEIRFLKERARAEHLVEIEQQSELLKTLPSVVEKLAGCQQSIEHLRVVQLNGAGETSLPNTPTFQIAQALTLLRELLAALKLS